MLRVSRHRTRVSLHPATALISQLLAENQRLRAECARYRLASEQDTLTGLPNLKAFNVAFTEAWGKAYSQGRNVGLVFCDLNNFKQVNDALGHEAGDIYLQYVAKALTEILYPVKPILRKAFSFLGSFFVPSNLSIRECLLGSHPINEHSLKIAKAIYWQGAKTVNGWLSGVVYWRVAEAIVSMPIRGLKLLLVMSFGLLAFVPWLKLPIYCILYVFFGKHFRNLPSFTL